MTDISLAEDQPQHRAAMLLIVTDGGLLLHHRDDKPGIANPGCWAGFGGAVEDGETVEQAVRREVREETGLMITNPVFLTETVDCEGDGRLVSLFYVIGGLPARRHRLAGGRWCRHPSRRGPTESQDHTVRPARAVNAPHLVVTVRAGAAFTDGKTFERPGETTQPEAA